jgi:antitoxin (DNA-binding transcriptional repressor) of toxin-antitoxin stability system
MESEAGSIIRMWKLDHRHVIMYMKGSMMKATVAEARNHLPELLKKADAGEEVIITFGREKREAYRIIPIKPKPRKKRLGFLEGIVPPPGPEFFEPLSDDELALWNGEDE